MLHNQNYSMPAIAAQQVPMGMMSGLPGQMVTSVVNAEPPKDPRLENTKKTFEKLAKDYATGQITAVKKNTTVKDGEIKSTFTPSNVARSNTAKRLIEKPDTVRDAAGNLVQAVGLDRKCTILSLNITGSVENVGCYLASRFKRDESRFSELCSMTGWTSYINTIAQEQSTSVLPENVSHTRMIRLLAEFEQYFALIKARSDVLSKTDVRNTEEGKAQIKELTKQMDAVAAAVARRLVDVTDVLTQAASVVICHMIRQQYPQATDDAIKDWINSDPNIYIYARDQVKANGQILPMVAGQYRAVDQTSKLFTLEVDLANWLATNYDDIHVSVDAQISMLEVVQLAQKHGLITDVYAAFPASLREQRVNVVNGGEYTAYPKFELADGYGRPFPLITEANAYKLGYLVPISFTAKDLLEDDETPKEKGVRTKKNLTSLEAIARLKAALIGKMEKFEDNDKILRTFGVPKGAASQYDSLLRRERVFVIGKTFKPEDGNGLTTHIKNSNHQFIWPQAPAIDVRSRTSDGKVTIVDNKLVFAAIARSLAFSKESKDVDKNTLPALVKSLTSLFFGDAVPVEYQNPVTGGAALYAASSMVGFSSPIAAGAQNSVFVQQAPPMSMPVAQYGAAAAVDTDAI